MTITTDMKTAGRFILWSTVFLLLLVALDQLLVRVHFNTPVVAQGRDFYVEFRQRLLHRPADPSPGAAAQPRRSPRAPSSGPRYVYVDGGGALQFADSLEEVPGTFRTEARRLER